MDEIARESLGQELALELLPVVHGGLSRVEPQLLDQGLYLREAAGLADHLGGVTWVQLALAQIFLLHSDGPETIQMTPGRRQDQHLLHLRMSPDVNRAGLHLLQ